MTGIGKRKQYVIKKTKAAIVTIGYEMLHGAVDVVLAIEGFDEVFLTFLLMRVLAVDLLIIHTHILLLDERRIGKHERTEITRSRCTIDITLKAHFDDIGYQAGMVDMRMAEHDAVNRRRIETEVPIGGICLHAFTLIHTAVQKNGVSRIGGNQMFASRHLASGS